MYYAELAKRVQKSRRDSGKSSKQVALELGIELSTYQGYESRAPLQLHLFERFCNVTGADPVWLLFGYQRPALYLVERSPPEPRPRTKQ